jgi:hypothetical protein
LQSNNCENSFAAAESEQRKVEQYQPPQSSPNIKRRDKSSSKEQRAREAEEAQNRAKQNLIVAQFRAAE